MQESLDDQLTFDLDGLIAAAEVDAAEHVTLQGRFADPRFERVFSGWYWQIEPDMPQTVDTQPETSRSLWDQTLVPESLTPGANNLLWGYATGPDRQRLRVLVRRLALPRTAEGIEQPETFRFMIGGDLSEMESDVARFNQTLFWWFAAFSVGLLAAIARRSRPPS